MREKLTPGYVMGCERILISDDYYPSLTEPKVEVVTDGIDEVRAHAVVTRDGTEREVDTIIFGRTIRLPGRGRRPFSGIWSC